MGTPCEWFARVCRLRRSKGQIRVSVSVFVCVASGATPAVMATQPSRELSGIVCLSASASARCTYGPWPGRWPLVCNRGVRRSYGRGGPAARAARAQNIPRGRACGRAALPGARAAPVLQSAGGSSCGEGGPPGGGAAGRRRGALCASLGRPVTSSSRGAPAGLDGRARRPAAEGGRERAGGWSSVC